ncbi:MAG: hypothetical protein QOI15_2591, partial [Pseudonocardiales bacterium]|nr:hypothetical protein [Pseudonocardiales bacterium]
MRYDDPSDEQTYLLTRAAEFAERSAHRQGRSRREVLKWSAAAVPALVSAALVPPADARPAAIGPAAIGPAAIGPIVKPLPPEWFVNYGTNAEMRWDAVDFG